MTKYFIIVAVLILIGVGLILFGIGNSHIHAEKLMVSSPHLYDKPASSIKKIHITALYFVPKNKKIDEIVNWKEVLDSSLNQLVQFHEISFNHTSKISYDIFPTVVTGKQDNLYYDTNITNDGNPRALQNITAELEQETFSSPTDFYSKASAKADYDYSVLLIMYEGIGASGGDNIALISRKFLTTLPYVITGQTVLTHEFYHTLGFPDGYNLTTGISTSEDIMGLSRFKTIQEAFIDRDRLAHLGL